MAALHHQLVILQHTHSRVSLDWCRYLTSNGVVSIDPLLGKYCYHKNTFITGLIVEAERESTKRRNATLMKFLPVTRAYKNRRLE